MKQISKLSEFTVIHVNPNPNQFEIIIWNIHKANWLPVIASDCTSAHKVYKLVLVLCIQYKDKHNLKLTDPLPPLM